MRRCSRNIARTCAQKWSAGLVALALCSISASCGKRPQVTPASPVSIRDIAEVLDGVVRVLPGWDASWAPDGKRLVMGSAGQVRDWETGVRIFSLETGDNGQAVPCSKDAGAPAWSPDGRWVGFVQREEKSTEKGSSEASIWIQRLGTQEPPVKVVTAGHPTWSADGALLFCHHSRRSAILTVEVSEEAYEARSWKVATRLAPVSFESPCLSQDGDYVAVFSNAAMSISSIHLESGISWPLRRVRGTSGLSSMGRGAGAQWIHGCSDVATARSGVWIGSNLHPTEYFRIWRRPTSRPAVSPDARFIACDEQGDPLAFTTVFLLQAALDRTRDELRRSVLEGDPPLQLRELCGFLRYRSPDLALSEELRNLTGPVEEQSQRLKIIKLLLDAYSVVEDPAALKGAEQVLEKALSLVPDGSPCKENDIRAATKGLLTEVLVALGRYSDAARQCLKSWHDTGSKDSLHAARALAELGRDFAMVERLASAIGDSKSDVSIRARALALSGKDEQALELLSGLDRARLQVCVRADGDEALSEIPAGADPRFAYYRARALLLKNDADAAVDAMGRPRTVDEVLLRLVALHLKGDVEKSLELAKALAVIVEPPNCSGCGLGYLLRREQNDWIREFLAEKGVPMLSDSQAGAAARMVGSPFAGAGNPSAFETAKLPEVPTAPVVALEIARQGESPPKGLLQKALLFLRRMEFGYVSPVEGLVSPYRTGSVVALFYLAGEHEEAKWRLDLAIMNGANPAELWLDPDIVMLRDPPGITEVFSKHGIRQHVREQNRAE